MTISKTKLILAYIIGWALAIACFWIPEEVDAMGYAILGIWIIQPALIIAASFLIGRKDYWSKYKWFMCIAFGIMYMLAEYMTFSLANNISFDKINPPEFQLIIYGTIMSLGGMAAGSLLQKKK